MISTNVNIMISTAMVGLTASTAQVFSENFNPLNNWENNADGQWWNNKVDPEYALSESQIVQMNKIRAKSEEKIRPLQNKLIKLRTGLNGVDLKTKSGLKKLKLNKINIRNLEYGILDINADTEFNIKKILTKDQSAYFNNGRYGWWNREDRCWFKGSDKLVDDNKRMSMSDRGFSW